MADAAFQLLMQHLDKSGKSLLIADENLVDAPLEMLTENTVLLTNRFDLYQQGLVAGINIQFSDFDFSKFSDKSFDQILYRVSKEKPVVHHIINCAKFLLKNGGSLLLVGGKNEGIKTYTKKAQNYLSTTSNSSKHGAMYLSILKKPESGNCKLMDDKNYSELRPEISQDGISFYSKPGVFGWNKIDQGSAFLIENLTTFLKTFSSPPSSLLDLGCGYGYLSVMAHQQFPELKITATDNNAAAIIACEKNFQEQQISGSVVADNCGGNITEKFDAVLCNPPFHQGFGVEGELTDRFLQSAHQHLKAGGKALFVVNRFVPLERKSGNIFKSVELWAENRGFKLFLLEK